MAATFHINPVNSSITPSHDMEYPLSSSCEPTLKCWVTKSLDMQCRERLDSSHTRRSASVPACSSMSMSAINYKRASNYGLPDNHDSTLQTHLNDRIIDCAQKDFTNRMANIIKAETSSHTKPSGRPLTSPVIKKLNDSSRIQTGGSREISNNSITEPEKYVNMSESIQKIFPERLLIEIFPEHRPYIAALLIQLMKYIETETDANKIIENINDIQHKIITRCGGIQKFQERIFMIIKTLSPDDQMTLCNIMTSNIILHTFKKQL